MPEYNLNALNIDISAIKEAFLAFKQRPYLEEPEDENNFHFILPTEEVLIQWTPANKLAYMQLCLELASARHHDRENRYDYSWLMGILRFFIKQGLQEPPPTLILDKTQIMAFMISFLQFLFKNESIDYMLENIKSFLVPFSQEKYRVESLRLWAFIASKDGRFLLHFPLSRSYRNFLDYFDNAERATKFKTLFFQIDKVNANLEQGFDLNIIRHITKEIIKRMRDLSKQLSRESIQKNEPINSYISDYLIGLSTIDDEIQAGLLSELQIKNVYEKMTLELWWIFFILNRDGDYKLSPTDIASFKESLNDIFKHSKENRFLLIASMIFSLRNLENKKMFEEAKADVPQWKRMLFLSLCGLAYFKNGALDNHAIEKIKSFLGKISAKHKDQKHENHLLRSIGAIAFLDLELDTLLQILEKPLGKTPESFETQKDYFGILQNLEIEELPIVLEPASDCKTILRTLNRRRLAMIDLPLSEVELEGYKTSFFNQRELNALFAFFHGLNSLHQPELIAHYKRFIKQVVSRESEDFYDSRYDRTQNEHLAKVLANNNLLGHWKAGRTKQEGNCTLVDTDHYWDLLMCGTEIANSCQNVYKNPDLNKCLLAYLMDGKNRLLAIKDPNGIILMRSILRILWDEKAQEPVLFMEAIYPGATSESSKTMQKTLASFAIERAEALQLSLFCTPNPQRAHTIVYPQEDVQLQSLGTSMNFPEYVDANTGTGTTISKDGFFKITGLYNRMYRPQPQPLLFESVSGSHAPTLSTNERHTPAPPH